MNSESAPNLAALLTPPGVGAIAVVRVSGGGVPKFLQAHFSRPALPGRCVRGELRDGNGVIDDAVAVVIDGGFAVDLCVHGGVWAVKAVLDLVQAAGFVVSEDIQATMDGSDLLEREMLAAVPLARTEMGLGLLLNQPRAWRRAIEAGADAGRILEDRRLWWLLHPPQVAIVGAANVGKSTLANQLFAQERSITADVPGTTRDWVGEMANIDGLVVMLVDTPGIRATDDAIERDAIAASGGVIGDSDLVVLVLDASRRLAGEQQELVERWPGAIRVINQVDRAGAWEVNSFAAVKTVATSGQGVDVLREAIRGHFGIAGMVESPLWWTMRQREILQQVVAGRGNLAEIIQKS